MFSVVPDEPVEFEKKPIEVQDLRSIIDHFTKVYRIIYAKFMKKTGRCSICKLVAHGEN